MRKFGIITAVSGLGGVGVGLFSSNKWKLAGNGRADAEICAIGQFVLGITTVVAVFVCYQMPDLTWTMGLIGLVGGCVNWALMVSICFIYYAIYQIFLIFCSIFDNVPKMDVKKF